MTQPSESPRDPAGGDGPPTYPAGKARQGEIVLRTKSRRFVFFGGLVLFVLLVLVGSLIA